MCTAASKTTNSGESVCFQETKFVLKAKTLIKKAKGNQQSHTKMANLFIFVNRTPYTVESGNVQRSETIYWLSF
jgi:hypothetical protein